MINLTSHNTCLSGGAEGSDLAWGALAAKLGHGVVHYSFAGHRTRAPVEQRHVLTAAELCWADLYCLRANETLRRRYPAKTLHSTNLLRRDWYQSQAHSCYAITRLGLRHNQRITLGAVVKGSIAGGTAWAVQMFIDRHQRAACDCFVFDQDLCRWFRWHGDGWQAIFAPPRPVGLYAGIGTRDLSSVGLLAIEVCMNDTADRERAERRARERFEERAANLEGHKVGAWESLSDLMREELIQRELANTK